MTVLAENLTITLPAVAINDANEHPNQSPITISDATRVPFVCIQLQTDFAKL